jgi:hypothetical protein
MSRLEEKFSTLWQKEFATIPLEREYRFAPPRRYRLDFAYLSGKVAIEINGGNWIGGRHSTADGLAKEYEKLRLLAMNDWLYYPLTGEDLTLNNLESLAALCLGRGSNASN